MENISVSVKNKISSFIFRNIAGDSVNLSQCDSNSEKETSGAKPASDVANDSQVHEDINDSSHDWSHDAAKSSPQDKEALMRRLQTFSPVTWCAKPLSLSPVVCARFGWRNVDVDRLQCVSCKVYLNAHLTDTSDVTVYDACCQRLRENLEKTHHTCCPWHCHSSPEFLYSVMYVSRDNAMEDFLERYQSFVVVATLPAIQLPELLTAADVTTIQQLCEERRVAVVEQFREVVCLALSGWTVRSTDVIHCRHCFRQIGLWSFKNSAKSSSSDEVKGHVTDNRGDTAHDMQASVPGVKGDNDDSLTDISCQNSLEQVQSVSELQGHSNHQTTDKETLQEVNSMVTIHDLAEGDSNLSLGHSVTQPEHSTNHVTENRESLVQFSSVDDECHLSEGQGKSTSQPVTVTNPVISENSNTSHNNNNDDDDDDDDVGPARKKQKHSDCERVSLDVLREHNVWCLWVNTDNESGVNTTELLIRYLLRPVRHLNKSSTPEGLQKIRSILNEWTSLTQNNS